MEKSIYDETCFECGEPLGSETQACPDPECCMFGAADPKDDDEQWVAII
jgi:hypothetical protein